MSDVEILARVERRRKWSVAEKAALIAEVEAEGGKVKPVAQRHRISESLLYNWRAAWKAAAAAAGSSATVEFVPLGVMGEANTATPHRRCCRRRNRHHRREVLKPGRVRSRSPCLTAAVSASMRLSTRRRCRACCAR